MVLYIGNKLSKHGNTPTSVETLGSLLSKEFDIITVSDKKYKFLRLIDMIFSILKYKKEIDLILVDTYSTSNFYYAFLSAVIAQFLGIRYIPILHGGNLPKRLDRSPWMSNTIFKNAFINVAPSGYLYEAFKKRGFLVKFVPNNINISEYKFKKRESLRPRLLYVRAFSKLYNPLMALDVVNLLKDKYPDIELCMVGPDRDGTLEVAKKRCIDLGLKENIIFTGKLSKEEWHKLSEDYDIFINTTNADNTPVSLIEAMALGLPIVTTDVGGIPYLVKEGVDALTVRPGNAKEMAQKIEWLLSDPDEAFKIATNARKKAESFDWEIIKVKWIELLSKDGE